MTDDRDFRAQVHAAVDAYSAPAREDPYLLPHVLARANGKEQPRMKKKLSTAAIMLLALLLTGITALAIGLSVEEIWRQSFEKMNTTGMVHSISDETQAEIPVEEAIAIAREAIVARYGTPEAELDAMGVYPGYFARGWDGMVDTEPSEWEVRFSSRTDVDLDHLDYGPTGEYLVQINAETREIIYCHWYTNDFWARAQTIWDCGSRDEVYWWYRQPDFYSLPVTTQAYWTQQLADAGYSVTGEDEQLHTWLVSASTNLLFQPLSAILDNSDAQVAAAWQAMAELGYDVPTLQRYAYVATRPDIQTGADHICIHFSFEKESSMLETGHLDAMSNLLYCYADKFGLFMFSFAPGSTEVVAVTHVTRSESIRTEPVTSGLLLERTDWTAADLPVFHAAYSALNRAVLRMRAAGMENAFIENAVKQHLMGYGSPYPPSEAVDADAFFAETSGWDALVTEPALPYEEFIARYGSDERFWPMEVLLTLKPTSYRLPNPGETTLEEAAQLGLRYIAEAQGEAALTALGDYQVFCRRVSLTNDPDAVDCRWEVYVVADPANPVDGWRVHWGEWEDRTSTPTVQHITDFGNG